MNSGNPKRETVEWIDASMELPDDEIEVIVACKNGEVMPAFHLDCLWRSLCAAIIYDQVTHWTHYPAHPCAPCPSVVNKGTP